MADTIQTIFGAFCAASKHRIDLTFDYETCAIRSFKDIAAHLKATDVIDIGANIGVYSVYTSALETVERAHAFEPAPETLKVLRENAALQAGGKIECHGLALSSENGVVSFNIVSPMAGNNAVAATSSSRGRAIEVEARRLDDVLPLSGRQICIKIDVEGHECETLRGAEQTLRSNACFLQVESLRPSIVKQVREILRGCDMAQLFTLQNDHLFISSSLRPQSRALMAIIAKNLAADLRDLTALRLEKRRVAAEAKKLWQMAGYARDPVLS